MKDGWFEIRPSGSGGARVHNPPAARIATDGTLFMNVATVDLLGSPGNVRILVNTASESLRVLTNVEEGAVGWTLAGGNNALYRIRLRRLIRRLPQLIGSYSVHQIADGIELRKMP